MSMLKSERGTPLIVLLLLVAAVFMLTGVNQATTNEATAATTSTYSSLITGFYAKNLTPVNGATEVAVDTNVSAGFTQEADGDTIDEDSFTLKRNGVDIVSATVTFSESKNVATLNPDANLEPGTTYVATLTNAILNTDGKVLKSTPVKWSFTTDTPPAVTSRTPLPGAVGVSTGTAVSIAFNKAMDASTINTSTFYMMKSGTYTAVGATVTYNASTHTATLTPGADLEEGKVYQITMTTAVKGQNGLSVTGAPIQWAFTTGADAPQVTAKNPGNGAINVPVDLSVTATFDQDMDAASIHSATFILQKNGTGTPIAATVSYSAATHKATLNPSADLEPGTTYEASLLSGIKGENDEHLAGAPVTWTYTTAGAAPVVTTKVPASGATGVPVNQSVSATFDQAMDAASITTASFVLKKNGTGLRIDATVTYSAATHTATLNPSADLENGTLYQATLTSSVEGENGETLAGAPIQWSFTTAGGTSSFSDVIPGVTPYSTAIVTLAGIDVIAGFEDGTFRPNDKVSRQQFAKMIVKALHLTVTGTEVCPFTDVAAQIGLDPLYPSKYVAVCAASNITQGTTPTLFSPYADITHQQLITMLARAAALPAPPISYVPPFTPAQFSVNEHYLNACKAGSAGLLDGLLGVGPSYNFLAGSTRGECAQLLYNLMDLLSS